jgi:hypothetical protein
MKTALGFFLISFTILQPLTPAFCDTVTYACRYDTYSNSKGLHDVKDEFKLVFVVDSDKQTAQIATDKGKFNVDMLPSLSGGMTFVEVIDGSKVLTTSIDLAGKSVHSRNIILEGRISPSQYYGTCSKR